MSFTFMDYIGPGFSLVKNTNALWPAFLTVRRSFSYSTKMVIAKKNNRRYYYTRSQNQVCVWRSGISEHTGPVLPKTMAWKSIRWLHDNSLDDLISVWRHRGFNNNLLLMCHIKGKKTKSCLCITVDPQFTCIRTGRTCLARHNLKRYWLRLCNWSVGYQKI